MVQNHHGNAPGRQAGSVGGMILTCTDSIEHCSRSVSRLLPTYRGDPADGTGPARLLIHRRLRCNCASTASAAKAPPSNIDDPGSGTTVTAALLLSSSEVGRYRVDQRQFRPGPEIDGIGLRCRSQRG